MGQVVADARNKGFDAYGVDLAEGLDVFWSVANVCRFCKTASADELPFPDNSMDLVTCFDVLEHIPEEAIAAVLKEMYRVTKKHLMVGIALVSAYKKMFDGSEPHICIKPSQWWCDRMEEAGFTIGGVGIPRRENRANIYATKEDAHARSEVSGIDMHIQPQRKVPGRRTHAEVQGSDRLSGEGDNSVLRV